MKLLKWLFVAIVCPLVVDAGSNGKLALFGGVQHVSGVGGFFGPCPEPLWRPIASGQASGSQFPSNWYRDDFSFNAYVWQLIGTAQMQASLATLASYLAANQINGPCIQLHYPHYDGPDKVAQTQYLQALAPYLPAGSYEIAANEVLNTSHKQSSSHLLNDLGGPGVTGYDGLIALIKLERRYLPGVLLGLNEFDVCSFDTGVPPN